MKQYRKYFLRGGTLYEAEMFYIPYFKLEKGILKCAVEEVPDKFKKLKSLVESKTVYYDISRTVYYTLENRESDKFYEDFECNRILYETNTREI